MAEAEEKFREVWLSPGKLWSLWEMLSLELGKLVEATIRLSATGQHLTTTRDMHEANGMAFAVAYDRAEIEKKRADAVFVRDLCERAGLDAAHTSASKLCECLQAIETKLSAAPSLALTKREFDDILILVTATKERVKDQLMARSAIILSSSERKLYEQSEPLFGAEVANHFSSAVLDIDEAGKCLSLSRWTAAVLHLMRALEPALKALEQEVQVNIAKEQWHDRINQIESAIKAMGNKAHTKAASKADLQWYSEAAAHFRFVKDAWRNYAAHGKDTYDEDRAMRIYENVRGFMMHLAKRLKE